MTRNLETLIEQFNRASEIDRVSRIATGETHWIEVDGVRTRMTDVWAKGLSPEEKIIFNTYIAQKLDKAVKVIGFENAEEMFKDFGQKIFDGLVSGIATYPKWLPAWARPILWHFRNFKYRVTKLVHSP